MGDEFGGLEDEGCEGPVGYWVGDGDYEEGWLGDCVVLLVVGELPGFVAVVISVELKSCDVCGLVWSL